MIFALSIRTNPDSTDWQLPSIIQVGEEVDTPWDEPFNGVLTVEKIVYDPFATTEYVIHFAGGRAVSFSHDAVLHTWMETEE
jgi:hypothetical protein